MRRALLSLLAVSLVGCAAEEGECPASSDFAPGIYTSKSGHWQNGAAAFPHAEASGGKSLTLERTAQNAIVRISYVKEGRRVVEVWTAPATSVAWAP